jgi:hypothetical protein
MSLGTMAMPPAFKAPKACRASRSKSKMGKLEMLKVRFGGSGRQRKAAASSFEPGNLISRSICASVAAINRATTLLRCATGLSR